MAQEERFSNGPEALQMRLVRQGNEGDVFNPEFIYSIFGEAQVIYGYENLAVNLSYASGSLQQHLAVTYDAKVPASSSVKPDDVEGTLYKWLPADYLKDESAFAKRVIEDAATFKPYGNRIGSYARRPLPPVAQSNGKGKGKAVVTEDSDGEDEERIRWEDCAPDAEGAVIFEAWHCTMATPGFRTYLRRIQPFVVFYIEGGEYIDEEDDRWEFVILYEREASTAAPDQSVYHFVGFCDLYPYLYWPNKTRMRLAQFIILPPFQGQGHGSRFYSTVYLWLLSREEVAEITVEDPSEAFQDLRDKADLNALLSKPASVMEGLTAPLDKPWALALRKDMKLGERQFARLLEMAMLLKLGDAVHDKQAGRAYRLATKERLYRFNYDVLAQMDRTERRDLLRTTFDGVLEDYLRIIGSLTAGS